ncbi:hypothetical protein WMY93_032871 [Mugilogobius chulae]|uniref:Uncharacterized protein n=1 Tax=Mugilogobius chulae TaxID=88201 RepID=A0AAW0MMA5_9GOBI
MFFVFLVALGTVAAGSSSDDDSWNEIKQSPKNWSKDDDSLKKVVQLLQTLITKVDSNATEVQVENNAVEVAAASQQVQLHQHTEGQKQVILRCNAQSI